MKIKNLTASTFVCLLPFIIIDLTSAEALNCRSPTTVIAMATDNATCPECLPCPPVAACKDGYSCQPDKPSTQDGEKQQYPTGAAEAWVQSVTGGGLADVPLDNTRWGDREEGEVYARENSDYITWYWPKSGDAIFDPTKLGSTAAWFDYRISSSQSSGGDHTSISLSAGMPIFFHDPSGGVSIFKRKENAPPSPPNDSFLTPYTNPEQAKVPADGLYPFGQRMWLSMYSNNSGQLTRMKNAGMTLSGPHYHGCSEYDYPPNITETNNYGMKMFWRLYIGSGSWDGVISKMKTPEGRTYLSNRIKGCIHTVLNDHIKNKLVVAWYGHPEEPIIRKRPDGSVRNSIKDQRAYLKFVRDIIAANDPKKRPYFVSERTDSGESNMTGNTAHTAGVMKQNYLMYGNNYDYENKDINERFLMGQWVREELKSANESGASYTGKLKPVIATQSIYDDPVDAQYRNEAWLRKAHIYDFYISIGMGAHGINAYTWAAGESTRHIQENLFLEITKNFTDNNLPEVFLWGDNRNDVGMQIISGPKTFTWNKYSATYTEPSIKFRNIQYGDNRYIMLVNSAKQAVTVKLSGFPGGLKLLNMLTGKSMSLGALANPSIEPLGVRMYKVSK